MLADIFELDGWDTHFLGANMPKPGIIKLITDIHADVLAISATITANVPHVAELIAAVRATPECQSIKIVVGGYPFRLSQNLWQTVGADGFAADADSACSTINELVATETKART